jgi:diguanylate cyclase (GGDEF)-like protein
VRKAPKASWSVDIFRRTFEWTTHLGARDAWATVTAAFLLVAFTDWVTGRGVSMSIGYTIVICLTAWTLRQRAGVAMIALTVTATTLINGFSDAHPVEGLHLGAAAATWNTLSRVLVAYLIVLLLSTLRYALDVEKWRADTDALTGVFNKGAFLREMRSARARAAERGHQVVLAYMDLDGFKGVNDRFGHAAGDDVLRAFASEAAGRIREYDLFARIGGDEFLALLVVPGNADAGTVAGLLHHRLNTVLRETGYPVTCSMGALMFAKGDTRSDQELIGTADSLMYEVKRAGKNALRVAFAETSAPAPGPMPKIVKANFDRRRKLAA